MSHTVLGHTDWSVCDSTSSNYYVPLAQDRLLVLAVTSENDPDTNLTNVQWGGIDMTAGVSVVTTATGTKGRAEIWYLDDAGISAAGDQGDAGITQYDVGDLGFSFDLTWSAGEPSVVICAAGSYKFVDQITPIDQTATIEDSTLPITNPLETTIDADAGSMTIGVGVCGNEDDYFWEPYWNERIDTSDPVNSLTMTVGDRIVSTLTTENVDIDFQGTLDTYQALALIELHRSSDEAPEIQLDNSAGGNAPVTEQFVEFDIAIEDNPNRFMTISIGVEWNIDQTGYVSLCQVDGNDAEYVGTETAGCTGPGCVGVHNMTEMWYYVAPPDGTSTIRVELTITEGGTQQRDFAVAAAVLYNVGPPDILSVKYDHDNEPLPTVISVQHPTEDLTENSIIIDSIVMGNPNPAMTGLSNQIKIADQQGLGSGSSRSTLTFKYSESTPWGRSSWRQFSDVGEPGLRAAMISLAIDSYSDSTAPSFVCTETELEDLTLEFCEETQLFRMNVSNQGDNVDVDFEFDTCTLQVLTIITNGTSSRDLTFTYDGVPITLTPNDTEDVSSQDIYLVPTGPYYLPTLVLEEAYSITFI